MTVSLRPRELGAVLRCDYHGCSASLTTGQILVRPIRAAARARDWIRGLDPGSGDREGGGRPSNRRADICPTHAVEERRKHAERSAVRVARQARRDALLKLSLPERDAERKRMRNAAAKARRAKRKASSERVDATIVRAVAR